MRRFASRRPPRSGAGAASAGSAIGRVATTTWPLPALAAWAACWGVFAGLGALAWTPASAATLAGLLGAGLAATGATPWRRIFIGAGFPLSLAAAGLAAELPAWAWLAPLALLAALYPVGAWRDAPLFPTGRGSLAGLGRRVALPDAAAILDAGCGLGDALRELRREYPRACCHGIERSRVLARLAALRCRFASVRGGDMWDADWSRFALVYVFQRPESMARVGAKAAAELADGAWLASLEFEAESLCPTETIACAVGTRVLWLYRAPFRSR